MNMVLTILVGITSINVFAKNKIETFFQSNLAQGLCEETMVSNKRTLQFINGDDSEIAYIYSDRINSLLKLVDINSNLIREFEFKGSIQDIILLRNEFYVLTETELYKMNREFGYEEVRIRTIPSHLRYGRSYNARGLFISDTKIYLAHGIHGVVEIDKQTNKILRVFKPTVPQPMAELISTVTDIEGRDGKLYLSYDDISLVRNGKAFEGILIYSLALDSIEKIVPVNQRKEAYYLSNLVMLKDRFVVTNLHLNYVHDLKKLNSDRFMSPSKRLWKYSLGKIIGRAFINEEAINGCFYDDLTNVISTGSFKY